MCINLKVNIEVWSNNKVSFQNICGYVDWVVGAIQHWDVVIFVLLVLFYKILPDLIFLNINLILTLYL